MQQECLTRAERDAIEKADRRRLNLLAVAEGAVALLGTGVQERLRELQVGLPVEPGDLEVRLSDLRVISHVYETHGHFPLRANWTVPWDRMARPLSPNGSTKCVRSASSIRLKGFSTMLTEVMTMNVLDKSILGKGHFIAAFLSVKSKQGRLVPLIPNACRLICSRYFADRKQSISLKARQMGSTTIVQASTFHDAIIGDPLNIATVSAQQEATERIFERFHLFHETMPAPDRPGSSTTRATT